MRKTKILSGNAYLYEAKLKNEEKFFLKEELNKILSFYGMRVASGEWKDYAIDRDSEKSSFSVYRHTSEMPLYKIVKIINKIPDQSGNGLTTPSLAQYLAVWLNKLKQIHHQSQ